MERVTTVVIGAGQAGLALSRCLGDRRIDHVLLERGGIAQRWRAERRPSLRLLTPSWMTRLPGARYDGDDPDGFMTTRQVADFLHHYATSFAAPVITGVTVESVRSRAGGFDVATDGITVRGDTVVVATGACQAPRVPDLAGRLPSDVLQVPASCFPGAAALPSGAVLVVGASASGVQVAAEVAAGGRDVVLAVGRHTRLPRTYRGRDIYVWLDRLGSLHAAPGRGAGHADGSEEPSAQLVGSPERRDVDLRVLQEAGVILTGRLVGVSGRHVTFADDLLHHVEQSDARLQRLRARIDAFVDHHGLGPTVDAPDAFVPVRPRPHVGTLDLRGRGIGTVVWATGYRRSYPWLHVPVVGSDGELRHRGGVTDVPGLLALGLPFQTRRGSTFIDGVGADAAMIAAHIAAMPRRLQVHTAA